MTDDQARCFVSAALGFWRLDPVRSDDTFRAHREPIVAWEMRPGPDRPNMNSFAHPVTVAWSSYRDAVVAILGPDGVVRLTNGTSFATEAEWLAHAKDEARAREEI